MQAGWNVQLSSVISVKRLEFRCGAAESSSEELLVAGGVRGRLNVQFMIMNLKSKLFTSLAVDEGFIFTTFFSASLKDGKQNK